MPTISRQLLRRPHLDVVCASALGVLLVAGPLAVSAQATVHHPPLKSAADFSVLGGSAVINTGATTIAQALGVSSGTALPDTAGANAIVVGGSTHSHDAVADQAQLDLNGAYADAAGQTVATSRDAELGGGTLKGGIYKVVTTEDMELNGTLTLDGANNRDSTWVFQAGRDLVVGAEAKVVLTRGANPCNVYWQVSNAATLGTGSTLVGTIMADQQIAMQTDANLQGRLLARAGAVTLDHNVITKPLCRPVGLTGGTGGLGSPGGPGGSTGGKDAGGASGTNGDTKGGTKGGVITGGTTTTGGIATTGGFDMITTTGTTNQVTTMPTGSVDTGRAGPAAHSGDLQLTGWALAAGFAALALFTVRRRRVG